jgi:hypothetical protein
MHIDRYKKPDGSYEDPEGCHHEDAESFLQTYVLGFCGCGRPEDSLAYVRDVLQHIDNLKQLVLDKKQTYEEWTAAGKKLFATDGAEYFAFYVMDTKGLTAHGGSVPGWLTDKGRKMLEDLNAHLANVQSEPRGSNQSKT